MPSYRDAVQYVRREEEVTPKHYPECPSWRGFGWCEGPSGGRLLVGWRYRDDSIGCVAVLP